MTPPIAPESLNQLLQALPAESADPFPHLADLTAHQLLQRRVEITGHLKSLEQERQVIDAELLEVFTNAELRLGVRASGGWVLKQRSRTSWDYAPEVKEAIKTIQRQAQRNGGAQPLVSSHLVAVQEGT